MNVSKEPDYFKNKRQGRNLSRFLKNKTIKVTNVSSLIHIEDEDLGKTQEFSSHKIDSSHTSKEPLEKDVEKHVKGKPKIEPGLEASF
jgi:hypothetical protein